MTAAIAAISATTPSEPTREQMQMAFRHYADHHWPATLDAALQRPAYRSVLLVLARRLNRPTWHARTGPQHRLPAGPVPPTPADEAGKHARNPHSLAKPGAAHGPVKSLGTWTKILPAIGRVDCRLDVKRLAANDKDDD